MCPGCKAMDHPDGRVVESNIHEPQGRGNFRIRSIKHVSLTDRHAKFWNRVADRVAEECPGLNVGAYGYSVFRDPPLEVTLRPNVVIGYVAGSYDNEQSRQAFLEGWKAWSEKCSQMYWRPNLMKAGEGFPLVWATKMGEDIRTLAAQSMIGIDLPNCFGHWGTQGLNYYMAAQMVWDPSQDPGAIIDDYCRSGFGPAADLIRAYIARLEELTHQFAVHEARRSADAEAALRADEEPDDVIQRSAADGASGWDVVWTDEVMADLQRRLDEAARTVGPDSPEAARIAVLQEGLDFAKLDLPARRALAKYERHPSEETAAELVTRCARVEQWMHAHTQSRGIAVIDGYAWWWRKMRVPPMRHSIYGNAQKVGDGTYLLSIGAFSTRGRFVSIEFSEDGKTWTPPVPYRVDHEFAPTGQTKIILARLSLKSAKATTVSEPLAIRLE
jgi:hypothetical protein